MIEVAIGWTFKTDRRSGVQSVPSKLLQSCDIVLNCAKSFTADSIVPIVTFQLGKLHQLELGMSLKELLLVTVWYS
jgi:hypothetical protein